MNPARFLLIGAFLLPELARAGPPFVTDDPVPVEYRHWEVHLASQSAHAPQGISGTLPQIEVNYGFLPDVQLHLIAADSFASAAGAPRTFGWGDTEVGVTWRLLSA